MGCWPMERKKTLHRMIKCINDGAAFYYEEQKKWRNLVPAPKYIQMSRRHAGKKLRRLFKLRKLDA